MTSGTWRRPKHEPAQPLSDAEREIQAEIYSAADRESQISRAYAARWRIENSHRTTIPEEVISQPGASFYVPSVNATDTSEDRARKRSEDCLHEILDPLNTTIGLANTPGGGFDGLFLNVLRTLLKRKLKREGRMKNGRWLERGPNGKKARAPKRKKAVRLKARKSAVVLAFFVLLLLSSPPWPGIC